MNPDKTTRPLLRDPRAHALLMAAGLITMANSAIAPALPGLEERFTAHPHAALLTRLLVPAPSVAVVLCAAWAGRLADRVGRRLPLLVGVGLFAIAGTLGLVLPSLESILASRLVLGIAVALILTSQTALVADYFDGPARSRLLGLQITARNLGGLASMIAAGALATMAPTYAFGVHAVALLMLPALWAWLPEPQPRPQFQHPTETSTQQGLHARVYKDHQLLGLACLQVLTTIAFFTMPTQIPFFLTDIGVANTVVIGAVMGALTLTGAGAASLYAGLRARMTHEQILSLGYGVMGGGMIALALAPGLLVVFIGVAAVGAGFALVVPNINDMALQQASPDQRGRVSGLLATSVYLGQIISPFLTLPLIQSLGYQPTFAAISAPLFALAALCLLRQRWSLT